jgi:HAD superfamily hydrolase (TIGR01509 family)
VEFTRDDFQKVFGKNNIATLKTLLGEKTDPRMIEEISDQKEKAFRQSIRGHVRTPPGVRKWLKRLKSRGARMAVASSAPLENTSELLSELRLSDYFHPVVSGAELPSKPDPTLFLLAARSIDLAPRACVVVEDSPSGVEAAKLAGMKCIAVATTCSPSALGEAQLVVERLDRLPRRAFDELGEGG